MNKKKVLEQVVPLAKEIAFNHGIELFDVVLSKRGGSYVLSVYIDKAGTITLEDCQKVHVDLNKAIDDLDPISESYFLEVASPGLDAKLNSDIALEKSIGKKVYVKTYVGINGQKRFNGDLSQVSEETVVLILDNGDVKEIPRDKISTIRLSLDI